MGQPEFVPEASAHTGLVVRDDDDIPTPLKWMSDRPAEHISGADTPIGEGFGSPGPDQGYALALAARFHGKLTLVEGEDEHDVIAGCVPIALARASAFGRAPVIHDLNLAFELFGYLDKAANDLVEFRKNLFSTAGHNYAVQRAIVSRVSSTTLHLTPENVREHVRSQTWQALLN